MTQKEKFELEKLLEEAIQNYKTAEGDWQSYELAIKNGDLDNAKVCMRKFDYHRGYAEGIYQVLACVKYKNTRMSLLASMLS